MRKTYSHSDLRSQWLQVSYWDCGKTNINHYPNKVSDICACAQRK